MKINGFSIPFVLIIISLSIFVILLYRRHTIKILNSLNRMLDRAIEGNFNETIFDETRYSAVECKMGKYLSASQISAHKVEAERNKIRALIADISHQTKTPISNILLYGELLKEQNLSSDSASCVEAMNEQAQKLQFLIAALVKMSRLEAGIIKVHPIQSDVKDMIEKIRTQYYQIAIEKGLDFLCVAPLISPQRLIAFFDEKWTIEAIGNIVDNAIKYTNQGSITLRIKPYEMFCCIEIADTGMGIAEEEQAQIFARFYRSKRVSQKSGVGIGLYLAREIIMEEGGYIKVQSKLGEGSVFSVYLPVLFHYTDNR
ncbi:MAG: HAMP domain-containing histidine kinase [Lachnospiraceae bacterium]|jgi:signal transduction histidine kinase|nr:HAMP domain-containing histidine kinase [Lachnospiraceae bacterium]MCX4378157.1 HAMP domain-containing sensor histidine kinase [Lachnospiraceae bacterium]